jgi:ferredoxin
VTTPGDSALYVKVDAAKCCGYNLCAEACPEVYKVDDQGFAYTESDRVPPGLEAGAREGADLCPEAAIYVGPEPPQLA